MTRVEPRRGVVVGDDRGGADVVRRLLSLVAWLRRAVSKLAIVGAVAAAVIGYVLLRHGFPGRPGRAVLTVIALVAVVAPPLVLGAFWFVLGEVMQLPDRLRRMPPETRDHAEQLRRLALDVRSQRRWSTLPRQIWQLTRLTASSRELLTPYAPILPLVSPPFLAAVVLSALAVPAAVVAALVVLLVLALG